MGGGGGAVAGRPRQSPPPPITAPPPPGSQMLRSYYLNNFQDGRKQDALDLVVGNFVVQARLLAALLARAPRRRRCRAPHCLRARRAAAMQGPVTPPPPPPNAQPGKVPRAPPQGSPALPLLAAAALAVSASGQGGRRIRGKGEGGGGGRRAELPPRGPLCVCLGCVLC